MTKEEVKKTLNMPSTTFSMNANAPKNDPVRHEWWIQNDIYGKVLLKNQNNTQKILHDGPPYANGKLHIGHALNKLLKDMFVRHWNMQGYYSQFVMGWDVHGLPIEQALLKMGVNTNPLLSINEKRDNCFRFACMNVLVQKEQFKNLGIFTDYNTFYKTSDDYIEIPQLRLFNFMIEKKLVYKALKPVYWSWSSQSALAEDEIEYAEQESDSIYITFDVKDNRFLDTSLIIWTTTPWTIPSNLAVAVNPKLTYLWIEADNKKYIIVKDRLEALSSILNWKQVNVLKEIVGKELEYLHYIHPLYSDEEMYVILADYVLSTDGTGLVHEAPAFGLDDYKACSVYNIGPHYCPINNFGKFDETVKSKELVGMFYSDANPIIIQWLKENNHLLKASKFKHDAAIDWRTKKPVIYRATSQWFIDLDQVREQLVNAVNNPNVKFMNDWARKNLAYMVGHRSEWCISRQRYWGIPIPIIYDELDNPILDSELIDHIIDLMQQAKTTNIWYSENVEYFLTDKYLKSNHKYHKEKDIMDVWFDSGTSHNMFTHFNWDYPVELYLEGADQYRGWFNSSSITGVIEHNQLPFKTLISHGFVLDEKGNKMSKSLGNTISPEEIEQQYGNDVFRWWVASSNWHEDVRIGKNIMKQVAESYRKIRNSLFRFTLSNLYDFDPKKDLQTKLEIEDLYIIKQLKENINKITKWFDEYNLMDITKTLTNTTINLSTWYFDIIKDVLYCDKKNSIRRKQIQTVLYYLFRSYLILLAPILPHISEEAYLACKEQFGYEEESIFLMDYLKEDALSEIDTSEIFDSMFALFFDLKNEVYAQIEKLRAQKIINKTNEVIVVLNNEELINAFGLSKLKTWLNVADVLEGNKLEVKKADNYKMCIRCWNYFNNELNKDDLCERCNEAIN